MFSVEDAVMFLTTGSTPGQEMSWVQKGTILVELNLKIQHVLDSIKLTTWFKPFSRHLDGISHFTQIFLL